jgi:hypothetical protein
MKYLSIAAIVKNEARYIEEWLVFHRKLGVEHFYIYDHESTDDLLTVLKPYLHFITYLKVEGIAPQLQVYRHAIEAAKKDTYWLGLVDIDEFILPTNKQSISKFLEEYELAPGVCVNWMLYGNSYYKTRQTGLVTDTFDYRASTNNPVNNHVKTILQPTQFVAITTPHHCHYKYGRCAVNEKYVSVNSPFSPNSTELIRVNHYFTKSTEEFRDKIERGRSDATFKRRVEELEPIAYNQVYDPVAKFTVTKQDILNARCSLF